MTLSCDATVDVIDAITITTTTRVLFTDAPPARMIVEALNREGDRFSTLGPIPLEWQFNFEEGGRPLRIIAFGASQYDAPSEIAALEAAKHKGYVVLVEGLETGSGHLTAKFAEEHFAVGGFAV